MFSSYQKGKLQILCPHEVGVPTCAFCYAVVSQHNHGEGGLLVDSRVPCRPMPNGCLFIVRLQRFVIPQGQ